ncbi:MAG: hypothetical protein H6550_09780 [Chitinophagales bacterium]|nr:hypothetical protein [Chitinophagales bacterium]
MIKQIAGCLLAGIVLFSSACKETDPMINDVLNEKMRDTLKKVYPSLLNSQIRVEVHDFQDVTILLGDKELFAKTDEQLQEVTKNIAAITYHLYNENNYLDEGKVIFIEKERELPSDSDPRKEYDMHLETFKKK